jgi:5-formyltetrahydrofolate cyclo-ligase
MLAFDRHGHRLGSGKGFYDRYLEGLNARTIGVAFECQMHSEDLPVEPHDRPLDCVVTEQQVYMVRNFRR